VLEELESQRVEYIVEELVFVGIEVA